MKMIINNVEIKDNERLEDLTRKGYKLRQNPEEFCFGIDAGLLSAFAKGKRNETVLDLCTGSGVIPILMEAKTKASLFYGVEIQPDAAERAARSVKLNGLEDKITIYEGDIKDLSKFFLPDSISVITCNPPYADPDSGLHNQSYKMAVAKHEILCTLEDVIRCAEMYLKPCGRFYMIHRPGRITDILCLMRQYGIEPKVLRFVQPYADKAPTMLLVEGKKGGHPGIKVPEPLVVYNKDKSYTEEILRLYNE